MEEAEEMAHKLEGDLGKFAVLDHIDTGEPKTTDLDAILNETARLNSKNQDETYGERPSQRERAANSRKASDKMDREDIVTVKYLPIEMSPAAASHSNLPEAPGTPPELHDIELEQILTKYQEESEKIENYSSSVTTRVSRHSNAQS